MNFSSIPAYLDPANWQQQVSHQVGGSSSTGGGVSSSQLPPPLQPPPPPPAAPQPSHGSIRPGSMAERARMANIPMPETALKCPRCESTNTKFCYFNNYSLTQPRHFCKTCRRYWTRGGALRTVPVGGGCRRNKRTSKSTTSKSPASSDRQTTGSGNNSSPSAIPSNSTGHSSDVIPPPLRFMAPLHHHQPLTDYEIGGFNYGGALPTPMAGGGDLNFQVSNINLGGGSSIGSLLGFPQFPFLSSSGLELPSSGMFGGGGGGGGNEMSSYISEAARQNQKPSSSRNIMSHLGNNNNSVKMEDNNQEGTLNMGLGRQFMSGIQGNNEHHHHYNWNSGVSAWSDLSGFSSSSSTRNQL